MRKYHRINNILGWSVFAIATTVYFLTLEPTASWWDCGEYISTAYKLQVGHPPGAPLFQMIGRFFSLFAFNDVSKVALMVNAMSAICSGFTIMFLFWSITMLAGKLFPSDNELTPFEKFSILGSGLVGALAYTFTDSFWFSAVEGEVYAMSSFFTAIVFWAILRWERDAEQPHHWRWLLLIAYLMGLSIGVHLLNLLTIPAIGFIFYFRKYKSTPKGIISTTVASLLILIVVMYGIIPLTVKLAGIFELTFVNDFGLPFNSGTIFYFLLIIGLITFGLIYTHRKGKKVLNLVILAFTFIVIGYSSFLMLVIRANAGTPINENEPSDAVSLLSYLNREQYGDWPLLYGPFYNAPITGYTDGSPVYVKDEKSHSYRIADARKQTEPQFDPRFKTFFPRMYSRQKDHIRAYKGWVQIKGVPINVQGENNKLVTLIKPTFFENLDFFFRYQVGHMYMRYFLWNFAGRQNDVEGYGGIQNGNWYSGIKPLDELKLGNQSNLPESMNNPAHNRFYLLPLLLGMIGFIFHVNKSFKDALVVFMIFFMTGLAILIYLNQTPFQPRERDYAYAGSFYAFAMWIGLGVIALLNKVPSKYRTKTVALAVTGLCLVLVPGIMAKEGWNDHDRSGKTACRDFAVNYLESCVPNSVAVTFGDNDTFPLWYAQDVENVRTDVRVLNNMLASGDWYIHQMMKKAYKSEALKFTLRPDQYDKGVNDVVFVYDRGLADRLELKDAIDFIASDDIKAKVQLTDGTFTPFLPTKKLKLTVDKAAVIRNGIVPADRINDIVPVIEWDLKSNYITKSDLMLLDYLATNAWSRPLYIASPGSLANILNFDKYFHLEGTLYRFMPVLPKKGMEAIGGINVDRTWDIMMNKAKYGNLNNPKVTVDRETFRNIYYERLSFTRLGYALLIENRRDSAVRVADRCQQMFPANKCGYDVFQMQLLEIYFRAGANEKGIKLANELTRIYKQNINYYLSTGSFMDYWQENIGDDLGTLQHIAGITRKYNQPGISIAIEQFIKQKTESLK
jgi:hypothetical protein